VPEPADRTGAGRGEAARREAGPLRTLLVAFAVCGVCAAVVTASVVGLRPYQAENQRRDRERRVRELVAGLPGVGELVREAGEARLELRVVDLDTGRYAPSVDAESLLRGEGQGEGAPIPPERDIAGIGRRPRYAPVYLLVRGGRVDTAILPVSGQGYLGTIRGYLAVAGDGNTVRGITFTGHEETPGLGGEIESPAWQARWEGKRLRDESGRVRIRVVQSAPAAGSSRADYEVQGISGATKTGEGVTALVRFWVGPDGFGPYLARLRDEREGGDA
jgi:Na+-transporting NADH:ubiquinone oxidoreductase subunit C